MCIIGIKNVGIDVIKEETLEQCWLNNGNGAGYAYLNSKNVWVCKKGFMTFPEFMKSYKNENFTKEHYYIVHFRFATSGNKDGGNTHPFNLLKSLDEMRQTEFKSKYIAFHNGSVGSGDGIYSDTMMHIHTWINPVYEFMVKNEYNYKKLDPILLKLLDISFGNNRWVLTEGDTLFYYGKGWVENDPSGVIWSNDMYKLKFCNARHPLYKANDTPEKGYRYWDSTQQCWMEWDYKEKIYKREKEFNKYNGSNSYVPATTPQLPFNDKNKQATVSDNGKIIIPFGKDGIKERSSIIINEDGLIEWAKAADDSFVNVMCPECFDDSNLSESTFVEGDFVCLTCGAVFMKDTGKILFQDPTVIARNLEKEI